MGVRYLIRNLEYKNGRLPFKLTFNHDNDFYLESDAYIDSYKEIGSGVLQYVGIDGSVIIHSKIVTNETKGVNISLSTCEIVETIFKYLRAIVIYFNIFNVEEDEKRKEKEKLILHFVIDGNPPCLKNRTKTIDENGDEVFVKDSYSLMSSSDKKKLHKQIIKHLNRCINSYNNKIDNHYEIQLLTNYDLGEINRGEGEIELYKVCQLLNKKREKDQRVYRNVIISSDSDLIAMMLIHGDKHLVIVSPLVKNIYITNYNVLTKALNLTTDLEIIKYVLLHFIFFGSDYNLGLMSNPNQSKQRIIFDGVKDNTNFDIDQLGRLCKRRRKRKYNDPGESNTEYSQKFLQNFKELLIYEGICSFMYYRDLENGKKYLLDYSPRLYENFEAKKYVPLINFSKGYLSPEDAKQPLPEF